MSDSLFFSACPQPSLPSSSERLAASTAVPRSGTRILVLPHLTIPGERSDWSSHSPLRERGRGSPARSAWPLTASNVIDTFPSTRSGLVETEGSSFLSLPPDPGRVLSRISRSTGGSAVVSSFLRIGTRPQFHCQPLLLIPHLAQKPAVPCTMPGNGRLSVFGLDGTSVCAQSRT